MAKILSISEARAQINAISEHPEEVTVTKYGEPVLTILPFELYEAMMETLEIVCDPEAMDALRQDIAALRSGEPVKTHSIQAVAEELGLEL
jgi:prevent-host-death family protein